MCVHMNTALRHTTSPHVVILAQANYLVSMAGTFKIEYGPGQVSSFDSQDWVSLEVCQSLVTRR